MRRVRFGVVLAAVLGVATAGAVDYNNGVVTVGNATSWNNATGIDIEADDMVTTANVVVTVQNVSADTTINGDITITANDQYSASLIFAGGTPSTTIRVNGEITLTGSTINNTQATLTLGASNYYLDVDGTTSLGENSTLTVGNDSIFVTNSLYVDRDHGATGSDSNVVVDNNGTLGVRGYARIADGNTLTVINGTFASLDTITFADGGVGTINNGGNMVFADVVIDEGGIMNVAGVVDQNGTGDFSVNGGDLTVSGTGEVSSLNISATAGTVTIENGGFIDIGTLNAGGTSEVFIDGVVADDIEIVASDNAKVHLQSNMTVDSAGALGLLSVRNNATVDIDASLQSGIMELTGGTINIGAAVQSGTLDMSGGTLNVGASLQSTTLNMTGGTINLNANTLTVTGPVTTASGRLNFNGNSATAYFGGGGVTFSGGGITVGAGATNAALTIGGGLTIGSGADLDTSLGSLAIGITGALELNGTLRVGYDTTANAVRLADITGATGGLSVGNTARVILTDAARRQAIAITNSGGEMLILATDAASATGTIIDPGNGSVIYTYAVRPETTPDSGGIWITGAQAISRDQIRNDMLGRWGQHEMVGENAGTLLPRDFTDAVIDASYIVNGWTQGYDSLSVSGQFNANALNSLVNPAASGAGYDALMLYNGSGLAMANQAMVSANAQILRYIARRTEDIRREIRGNDLVDPDSYDPEPLPPSRVWAEALYHTDKASPGDGFAGYYYSGAGIMAGYEQLLGDLAVGGSASYLAGHYEDRSALAHGSKLDTYGVDLYATLTAPSGWFGSLTLGYGYTDNRLRDYRVLNGVGGWNSADYGSHTLKVSASFGRDFWIGDHLTLSPSAGFDYVGSRSAEHQQFFAGDGGGGGAETLEAGAVKNHSSRVPIGLSASYNVLGDDESLLTLTGNVGYAYELNDEGASGVVGYAGLGGHVAPVRIVRRDMGRHAFTAGVRGKYYFRQYELGFGYDYIGKRRNHQHTLWVNGGMSF